MGVARWAAQRTWPGAEADLSSLLNMRPFRWVFRLPVMLCVIGYGIYNFVDGLSRAHRQYRLSDLFITAVFVGLALNRHKLRRLLTPPE